MQYLHNFVRKKLQRCVWICQSYIQTTFGLSPNSVSLHVQNTSIWKAVSLPTALPSQIRVFFTEFLYCTFARSYKRSTPHGPSSYWRYFVGRHRLSLFWPYFCQPTCRPVCHGCRHCRPTSHAILLADVGCRTSLSTNNDARSLVTFFSFFSCVCVEVKRPLTWTELRTKTCVGG